MKILSFCLHLKDLFDFCHSFPGNFCVHCMWELVGKLGRNRSGKSLAMKSSSSLIQMILFRLNCSFCLSKSNWIRKCKTNYLKNLGHIFCHRIIRELRPGSKLSEFENSNDLITIWICFDDFPEILSLILDEFVFHSCMPCL